MLVPKDLDPVHRHEQIFKVMTFPDTEKLTEKPNPAFVQVEYTCQNDICDFSEALTAIKQNTKLLQFKARNGCESIVQVINDHQQEYLPATVDGYSINRVGFELVHLKRLDSDEKSVTGWIDYNHLRKASFENYQNKT